MTLRPAVVAPALPSALPVRPAAREARGREDGGVARPQQREAGGKVLRGPSGVYRVGGAIREPKKLRNVSPSYPEIAKQARVQGVVILEATIGVDGTVTSVTVLRGIPLLDASAIQAVQQWVYEPTLLNGVPVPVIMTVTVNYRLS